MTHARLSRPMSTPRCSVHVQLGRFESVTDKLALQEDIGQDSLGRTGFGRLECSLYR